jgi:hypothetical protein
MLLHEMNDDECRAALRRWTSADWRASAVIDLTSFLCISHMTDDIFMESPRSDKD